MKTSIFTISVCFFTLILFLTNNAYACSCIAFPDYLQTLMESKAAFQGTVTKIIPDGNYEEIYFDVTFPQKGTFADNQHMIKQLKLSSCAVNYKIGETYQVFTHNDGLVGTTGICDTKQITGFNEYSHEDESGKIEHYREDYNIFTQYNFATIIVPVVIPVAVVSFFVWRKRK